MYNAKRFSSGMLPAGDKARLDDTVNATMSSPLDVSGWRYQKIFSVAGQESGPIGLYFRPDGLKMYVIGQTGDDVNEYTLTTPWDIGTATFTQVSATLTQDGSPADLFIRADGTKLYIVGDANNTVYQYTMSTPWDVSTITYDSISFSVSTQENTPTGIHFSSDGTKMFICGQGYDGITSYILSTPWNVSTATVSTQFSMATFEIGQHSVRFSDDGQKMYVLGSGRRYVYEYRLSAAWDISAPVLISSFNFYFTSFSTTSTNYSLNSAAGLYINDTNAYIVCSSNDAVFQYDTTKTSLQITNKNVVINTPVNIFNNLQLAGNISADQILAGGTISASGDIQFSGGDLVMGSTTNNVGYNSTATNTMNLSNGATISGSTKTINIGPNGVSGSTTAINIGSTVAGATNLTTVTGNAVINANTTTDALRITQTGTGNVLVLEDSTNPDSTPIVVNQLGVLIHGTTTAAPSGANYNIQINTDQDQGLGLTRYGASANPVTLAFTKTRGNLSAWNTIVNSGDTIGVLEFRADDGNGLKVSSRISAVVDAAPSDNIMPGRLTFDTCDTAGNLTERLRIDSTGKALFANDVEVQGKHITTKSALTIVAGVVTATKSYHTIAGEGGVADDLVTINGGVDGMRLVIRAVSDTVDITVKHNTGNIFLDGTDFVMNNQYDLLELIYDSTLAKWIQLARANNGA